MKSSRIKNIEKYIIENETVSLDTLCTVFNVSKNTIRRDINELEDKGIIKKIYGGVTANLKTLVPFEERNIKNSSIKKLIAEKATEFVNDGDIIFIDSGTTTLYMIDYLKDKHVTILTNNLSAINSSMSYDNLNIICVGGTLIKNTNSFAGINTLSILKDYNINKAFMAATGISITKGATNSSPMEYEVKKMVVNKSDEVYLLVDSSKFNVSTLMTYCSLKEISYLITNENPPKEYLDFFKQNNIHLSLSSLKNV